MRLSRAYREGFRAKATKLTDEFTFDAFKSQYGELLVLMTIDAKGVIEVNTSDAQAIPEPGETVVALVKDSPVEPKPIES